MSCFPFPAWKYITNKLIALDKKLTKGDKPILLKDMAISVAGSEYSEYSEGTKWLFFQVITTTLIAQMKVAKLNEV